MKNHNICLYTGANSIRIEQAKQYAYRQHMEQIKNSMPRSPTPPLPRTKEIKLTDQHYEALAEIMLKCMDICLLNIFKIKNALRNEIKIREE